MCIFRVTIFSICWSLMAAGLAQGQAADDFSETVIPLTELKIGLGIEVKFGTGFCLDSACRFIATNYHVAAQSEPKKIRGQRVVERYLATGPEDEGATLNASSSVHPMKFTLNRDLGIFELLHPIPKHHGLAFSLDDLQEGQQVDIYAFPKASISPIRKLTRFSGTFKGETATGLLAFDYTLSDEKTIRPGASGGIVVDRKTKQIVGVLNGIDADGDLIATAVPIQSLAEFVRTVRPFLAANVFPSMRSVSPFPGELYPKLLLNAHTRDFRSAEESYEVQILRSKAQLLADSMRNFIAVQTYAWGSGDKEPTIQAAYEVRIIDGKQQFRLYPEGKKELREVPLPLSGGISPGDVWSDSPGMVGTTLRLNIRQAPDAIVNGRAIKVFQFNASSEDDVCSWGTVSDFGLFTIAKAGSVGCYGEVWTDEDTNIIRISQHYEMRGNWKDYQDVVTYGWLNRADEPPRRIPLTMSAQAQYKNHTYWCRGQFTHYREFAARVRLVTAGTSP
jgi:hypothetical protein